jgi:hypothetical protein
LHAATELDQLQKRTFEASLNCIDMLSAVLIGFGSRLAQEVILHASESFGSYADEIIECRIHDIFSFQELGRAGLRFLNGFEQSFGELLDACSSALEVAKSGAENGRVADDVFERELGPIDGHWKGAALRVQLRAFESRTRRG